MKHNIPKEQEAEEDKNIKAAMWANQIMTKKISNSQCKFQIAQSVDFEMITDMEGRVRRYLNAGLVTSKNVNK